MARALGLAVASSEDRSSAADRMRHVAETFAAPHAAEVDREARFPAETIDGLKQNRLLGVAAPRELGGEGLSLAEVADLCCILAQHCGSSAMIYAMHNIKLSSLISHGRSSPWHTAFLREIAAEQLLLASATTEAGIGGDLRNSICAIEPDGDDVRLEKEASVISYGRYADAILATARRAADAQSSDQVMVVLRRGQVSLTQTSRWDTLGMRGTCSDGFKLVGRAPRQQVFPKPFAEIAAQSMLATSHILWSSVWFGIAADAVARAQAFVRAAAKRMPATTPPGALRLAEITALLQDLKSNIIARVKRFEAAQQDEDDLSSMSLAVEINNLKVSSSELAARIVNEALLICGIAGYKNDTPFSLGRNIRDALSAAVMINNDRILTNTSTMLLVSRFNTSLAD